MAKIKDIADGFYNNNTIYSPNGYTQARKIANAIIDRTMADMQNEIQQGEINTQVNQCKRKTKVIVGCSTSAAA